MTIKVTDKEKLSYRRIPNYCSEPTEDDDVIVEYDEKLYVVYKRNKEGKLERTQYINKYAKYTVVQVSPDWFSDRCGNGPGGISYYRLPWKCKKLKRGQYILLVNSKTNEKSLHCFCTRANLFYLPTISSFGCSIDWIVSHGDILLDENNEVLKKKKYRLLIGITLHVLQSIYNRYRRW